MRVLLPALIAALALLVSTPARANLAPPDLAEDVRRQQCVQLDGLADLPQYQFFALYDQGGQTWPLKLRLPMPDDNPDEPPRSSFARCDDGSYYFGTSTAFAPEFTLFAVPAADAGVIDELWESRTSDSYIDALALFQGDPRIVSANGRMPLGVDPDSIRHTRYPEREEHHYQVRTSTLGLEITPGDDARDLIPWGDGREESAPLYRSAILEGIENFPDYRFYAVLFTRREVLLRPLVAGREFSGTGNLGRTALSATVVAVPGDHAAAFEHAVATDDGGEMPPALFARILHDDPLIEPSGVEIWLDEVPADASPHAQRLRYVVTDVTTDGVVLQEPDQATAAVAQAPAKSAGNAPLGISLAALVGIGWILRPRKELA